MAGLSPTTNLGGSASSLLRSSRSLTDQIQAYQDSLQAFTYQNSAYTDDAFKSYSDYLSGRISTLQATGSITDAQKALTLTKTLESAMHSNISASITRENIQIMGGSASKTDKLNLIGQQFNRAMANGDMTLAQSLESQYYSLSQTIQFEAQQAADARTTLAKSAAAATDKANSQAVSDQSAIVTNLKDAIGYFKGLSKNASLQELNQASADFAKNNKAVFQSLGVNIGTASPNYFDVVTGIIGAVYNHTVLQAQAKTLTDKSPGQAAVHDLTMQAANILNGQTKFETLGGNLTLSEIQQASADPNMFAYDNTSGTFKQTKQIGYQYENQITGYDNNGNPQYSNQLVPQFSGEINRNWNERVNLLSPNETKAAVKLGLVFTDNSANKNAQAGKAIGVGVQVQASNNTPDWLKKVIGQGGLTRLYTDPNGDITFEGGASSGQGRDYYTLVTDGNGLHGLFEHSLDGKIALAGGDYGFNAGAAQMLINQGQQTQYKISLQQAMQAAQLKQLQLAKPAPLPPISVPRPAPPPQHIAQPPRVAAPQPIQAPQPQIQRPTINPQQPAPVHLQGGSFQLQGGGGGIRLQ